MSVTSPLLIVEGLRVAYGGIQAVRGITFHINQGEMVALIGANGAGKTSTLKALARLLDAAGGSVCYAGKEIVDLPPHQLVGAGIALVPEGRGVFPRMSIVENLLMGAYCRSDKLEIARDVDYVYGLLPRLKERAQQLAGTLSGGEQQMLAIGRALMLNPKLLLLDEPLEGLAPLIVQELLNIIQQLTEESGMAVILVEQHARQILPLTRQALVLERGKSVYQGAAQTLLDDSALLDSWLGVSAH